MENEKLEIKKMQQFLDMLLTTDVEINVSYWSERFEMESAKNVPVDGISFKKNEQGTIVGFTLDVSLPSE